MAGQMVEVTTQGGRFAAYLAQPKSGAPRGGVVVIQEIFGVNHIVRGIADNLAEQGYVALAPDLFWRIRPGIELTDRTEAEWGQAFDLYNKFDVDLGVQDIQATITHLRSLVSRKVGAVGFCLGGLLAFLTATRTDVDASVGYYGLNIDKHVGEAEKLACPLMLHIAGKDQYVPPSTQEVVKAELKNHADVTLYVYEGQDHAFARKGGAHYDPHAAELADARTLAFFRQHIG
jgi:carboxymethylenebutenolidase